MDESWLTSATWLTFLVRIIGFRHIQKYAQKLIFARRISVPFCAIRITVKKHTYEVRGLVLARIFVCGNVTVICIVWFYILYILDVFSIGRNSQTVFSFNSICISTDISTNLYTYQQGSGVIHSRFGHFTQIKALYFRYLLIAFSFQDTVLRVAHSVESLPE